jgi:predicted esterase
LFPAFSSGAELPRGQIVAEVQCAEDASQSYALYLPSNYSESRPWSVLFLFDPGARGRRGVERYQAAAEKFGYILAGSNNSRNGPWDSSIRAALAMIHDAGKRFAIDPQRLYTAGLSGGARVAMGLAMETGKMAGVIASSAGFPDSQPHKTAPFDLFGTAGTEDFNYLEMREIDRTLATAHRISIFEGGHTWLPAELATEALEWMELRAMKNGKRARDEAFLEQIFQARTAQAEAQQDKYRGWLAWSGIASDFQGLHDVSVPAARAAALQNHKEVKEAFKRSRSEEAREQQYRLELAGLVQGRRDEDAGDRQVRLVQLQGRLSRLAREANASNDTPSRRVARRLLANASGAVRGLPDPDVQKIFEPYRRVNPFP